MKRLLLITGSAMLLMAADTLPPQNQPTNVTQVGGVPVSGSIPINVAGDGGVISVNIVGGAASGGGPVTIQGDGGTLPVVGVGGQFPITVLGDGGTLPVVVEGPAYIQVNGDGGTLPVVQQGPVNIQVNGDGGTLPQTLVGSTIPYSAPIPVDISEQTSSQMGVTLCPTGPGTAIGVPATGSKSQLIYNAGPNPVCFGNTAALSCPPAVDAGTTIGIPLYPGVSVSINGDQQMYCISPATAPTTGDAGLTFLFEK